jgi:hypothetical protein
MVESENFGEENTELKEGYITQCYILFLGDYRGNTRERV